MVYACTFGMESMEQIARDSPDRTLDVKVWCDDGTAIMMGPQKKD